MKKSFLKIIVASALALAAVDVVALSGASAAAVVGASVIGFLVVFLACRGLIKSLKGGLTPLGEVLFHFAGGDLGHQLIVGRGSAHELNFDPPNAAPGRWPSQPRCRQADRRFR